MVKAVIFDWEGTLTPWSGIDIRSAWRTVARRLSTDHVDELTERLLAAEVSCWDRAAATHQSSTMLDVLRMAGIATADLALDEVCVDYRAFWEPHTRARPGAGEVLDALRRTGVLIGLLSNTLWPREWHDAILARDGLRPLIDATVYSSELRWTKPHPAAFHAAVAAVGLDPRADLCDTVFVGDRPIDDIGGARAVGMRTVWVPHSPVPGEPGRPDAVLTVLDELPGHIRRWQRTDSAARR
jgi:putative hydrolase of the HAD superfamily